MNTKNCVSHFHVSHSTVKVVLFSFSFKLIVFNLLHKNAGFTAYLINLERSTIDDTFLLTVLGHHVYLVQAPALD